jgi:hypothetical protein
LATGFTDANLVFTTATVGIDALFQSTTYTAATMQASYGGSSAATITEAHQASLITILNTAGTALLAAQTAVNAYVAANDTTIGAAYFSIPQNLAFQVLGWGDVTEGLVDQAPNVGTIEVALSLAHAVDGGQDTQYLAWSRAEVAAAIENLKDYIVNVYVPTGGTVNDGGAGHGGSDTYVYPTGPDASPALPLLLQ